jgi:hypothetical protein
MTPTHPASKSPHDVKAAGFLSMPRPAQKLPKAIDPNSSALKVAVILDGVVAQPRPGRDIGSPIAGALEWLAQLHADGCAVFLCDERPTMSVWAWLQKNSPLVDGILVHLEEVVQICAKRPSPDVTVDPTAVTFDGRNFPDRDQLASFKPWWKTQAAEEVEAS